MQTYVFDHVEKGRIEFTDKKRWFWMMAIVWSLLPVLLIAAYASIENIWLLVVPLELALIMIPVLDYFLGTDTRNPPEEIVPQLNKDPFYGRLLVISIPAHFITITTAAWLVGNYNLGIVGLICFSLILLSLIHI